MLVAPIPEAITRPAGLAALIDHTIFGPDATAVQVRRGWDEAIVHCFFSVSVNPVFAVTDLALMRAAATNRTGFKVSGGIHDFATALTMVQAGATRIGAGIAIVTGRAA